MTLLLIFLLVGIFASGLVFVLAGMYTNPYLYFALPGMIIAGFLGAALLFALIYFPYSLCIDTKKPVKKPNLFILWFVDEFVDIALLLNRVKIHVTGLELLPKENFLIISNHRSAWDHPVIMKVLKRRHILCIMKPETTKILVGGPSVHRAGFIAIDRDDPMKALKSIVRASNYLKEYPVCISLSPEGTRAKDLNLLPFHNGSLKAAVKANAPIVVSTLQNCEVIRKRGPLHRTDVYFDIIKVIRPEEYQGVSTVEVGDLAHKAMEDHLLAHDDRQIRE